MKFSPRIPLLLSLLVLTLPALCSAKPNIVFILVDDMGYSDLSCYGAPDVKTPRIDDLASEGIKFTQFYAIGAECTPSRTGLLTGRYPQRVGGMECAIGTGNVGRYDDAIALAKTGDLGLPADQAVLAPSLKAAGYTNAVFGKWHLGYNDKFNPLDQGFDQFFGFLGGNVEYFGHFELSDIKDVLLEGRKPVTREGYMTHLITEDSVKFIEAQKKEQPFFLYVAHSTPHFPFQSPEDAAKSPHPEDQWTAGTRADYLQMIVDMDENVGKILDALDRKGLAKDTIVVFASDHGAMKPGLNEPLRDYKGTLFEGGVRIPCIVRWPAKIKAGQTSTQVGTLMDLTKSFLRVAEAKPPKDLKLDGMDILQHIDEKKADIERKIYWRARRDDRTWTAMRDGDWKYVRKNEGDQTDHWLFNLKKDPSESNNLIDEAKDQWKAMTEAVAKWENEVKAPRP